MDMRRRKKIEAAVEKADEYLRSAELLLKHGLYTPSVTAAYYCAHHAAVAAFLTSGSPLKPKGSIEGMIAIAVKFSENLDPFLVKQKESRADWSVNTSLDYLENDALLRFYQTREFFLEVKDFLRRTIR